MQTYTHLAIGAAIGVTAFPIDYVAQAACIAAAAGPDMMFALEYAADRLSGKKPFSNRQWYVRDISGALHSILAWAAVALAVFTMRSFLSLIIQSFLIGCISGWASHIVVDMFTHGGDRSAHGRYLAKTDVSYLWPLDKIHPAFAIRLHVWEYRYDHGLLWPPKPFEAVVLLCSLAYIISFYKELVFLRL